MINVISFDTNSKEKEDEINYLLDKKHNLKSINLTIKKKSSTL